MAHTFPPDALLSAISELARSMPVRMLVDLANNLEVIRLPEEMSLHTILARLPSETPRAGIIQLFTVWQRHHATLPGQCVAWSLRSAAVMDGWHRAARSLEVVWTGPVPAGTVMRRTDQALYELVRSATHDVLLVTFAAYRVERLRLALAQARQRGVTVTFVVESPDVGDGRVAFDPMIAFGADLGARVWIWPAAKRVRDDRGRHGTLHAKCALADARSLLVSSANLTGDALALNMELGLLVEGGEAPVIVREHFHALMRSGALVEV